MTAVGQPSVETRCPRHADRMERPPGRGHPGSRHPRRKKAQCRRPGLDLPPPPPAGSEQARRPVPIRADGSPSRSPRTQALVSHRESAVKNAAPANSKRRRMARSPPAPRCVCRKATITASNLIWRRIAVPISLPISATTSSMRDRRAAERLSPESRDVSELLVSAARNPVVMGRGSSSIGLPGIARRMGDLRSANYVGPSTGSNPESLYG